MIEHDEQTVAPNDPVVAQQVPDAGQEARHVAEQAPAASGEEALNGTAGEAGRGWHAEAGRKGARRVHQLIQEGRQYEQEHGLKRGRQRLRQLIEMGKLYEQEQGLRPAAGLTPRLSRDEVVATLLECLVRIARPSYRAKLSRLVEALGPDDKGHAA